jgi:hypothetical protein
MFTRPRSVTVALSLCLSVFSPALGDATDALRNQQSPSPSWWGTSLHR